MPDPEDNALLRLADAATECFRPGDMTVSGLRRERDRGNLGVYRIAGKDFTTKAEIKKMIERCMTQAEAKVQARLQPARDNAGCTAAALAAARMRVEKLKRGDR